MAAEADVDRLSDLPDAVLVSILSLLPLDEAARCTVLAARWRRLFPSTLLLDFNACMPSRRSVIRAVYSILAAHPAAPVRSFRADRRFRLHKDPSAGLWLRELARRGLEELSLDFDNYCGSRWIPESLFACASLRRLRLSNCVFPDAPEAAAAPPLPHLTEVDLWSVSICDGDLKLLRSLCPALERLKMKGVNECGRVHVRSPSLKTLNTDGNFDELFIDYAPNLEWVFGMYPRGGSGRGVHLKVVHAPKLEFLGYLGMNMKAIEIGATIFTEDQIDVKTLMPSLKTLGIRVSYTHDGYINWIMQLLKLFPCLETLYIKSDTWSIIQDPTPESWDVLGHVPCIDSHLKKVVFEVNRGHEWQREMAKFIHGRSRFLEAMEFYCVDDSGSPGHFKRPSVEWARNQQELLCLDSRASKNARFLFFKGQLVANHQDICHHEWYKRKYYDDLFEI
ncbi:hypothetical protein ACP4OV_025110 [Aristida adscensionis]